MGGLNVDCRALFGAESNMIILSWNSDFALLSTSTRVVGRYSSSSLLLETKKVISD